MKSILILGDERAGKTFLFNLLSKYNEIEEMKNGAYVPTCGLRIQEVMFLGTEFRVSEAGGAPFEKRMTWPLLMPCDHMIVVVRTTDSVDKQEVMCALIQKLPEPTKMTVLYNGPRTESRIDWMGARVIQINLADATEDDLEELIL